LVCGFELVDACAELVAFPDEVVNEGVEVVEERAVGECVDFLTIWARAVMEFGDHAVHVVTLPDAAVSVRR